MIHFIIIFWSNQSGVWIWNWFIVKFNCKIWSVDFDITIINDIMINSPHDSWNNRAGVGSRGPGFEVRCYRLASPLSPWFVWFITMKGVELIRVSSKTWWGEFRDMDDSGINFLSNYSTTFENNLLYHAEICNNWLYWCCIIVDGRWRT